MKTFHFPQYSPEWWRVRRGVPSASNFDKILTPKTGKVSACALNYICQLVGDLHDPSYGTVTEPQSAAMQIGIEREPEARRYYELTRDCEVQQVGFCLDDSGRFGCSPDALVGSDGGLEIKNPSAAIQVRYLLAETLPDEYAPQVHGQLLVTGRAWWDFLSYAPGLPPLLVRVTPSEYTKKLGAALEQFHEQYQRVLSRLRQAA